MERLLIDIARGVGRADGYVDLAREPFTSDEHEQARLPIDEDFSRLDDDIAEWLVGGIRCDGLDRRADVFSGGLKSKHRMIEIEEACGLARDKELRIVRVIPAVGHGEHTGASVLQIDVEFVVEPHTAAAGTVTVRIAPLDHKGGSVWQPGHAMEE